MKRPIAIFGAGLVLRLIAIAYLARVMPQMLSWGVNEPGGIARWIVTNHTFSSPFHDAHGPTAWIAPIFPGIVAVTFLVFGVQTPASAVAVMCLNAIASAATGVIVYKIGKELHSESAGVIAGWMWALSPYLAILPYILWDTALSALLGAGLFWLTMRLAAANGASSRKRLWVASGVTWGVAGLVNPALLAPFPVLALWLLDRGRKWREVLVMATSAMVIVTPWIVRNYVVFEEFMPIRSNGLTEIYFANCGFATHPLGPSLEYQTLGEAVFTARCGRRAIAYVRSHPVTFIADSARRAIWFWIYPLNFWPLSILIDLGALAGLVIVIGKSRNSVAPLLAVLAVYPLIYYASQVVSRYRHPIDPVLYVLSGVALSGTGWSRVVPRVAARVFRRRGI